MNAASFLVNTAASGLIKMKLHFPPYEAVNKLLDELVQKDLPTRWSRFLSFSSTIFKTTSGAKLN
jgi:hypothetical protein